MPFGSARWAISCRRRGGSGTRRREGTRVLRRYEGDFFFKKGLRSGWIHRLRARITRHPPPPRRVDRRVLPPSSRPFRPSPRSSVSRPRSRRHVVRRRGHHPRVPPQTHPPGKRRRRHRVVTVRHHEMRRRRGRRGRRRHPAARAGGTGRRRQPRALHRALPLSLALWLGFLCDGAVSASLGRVSDAGGRGGRRVLMHRGPLMHRGRPRRRVMSGRDVRRRRE